MLRQGTRIKGSEDWVFPTIHFDEYAKEILKRSEERLNKKPKQSKIIGHRKNPLPEDFDISKIYDVNVYCEMGDYMKDEMVLKDIKVFIFSL